MFDLAAANVVLLARLDGNTGLFVLKCVKHEGTISLWAPLAALRHAVARRRLYPFSSFLPARPFNKVRPRGSPPLVFFVFFYFLYTLWFSGDELSLQGRQVLPLQRHRRRLAVCKPCVDILNDIENINNCLHFNPSRVLADNDKRQWKILGPSV